MNDQISFVEMSCAQVERLGAFLALDLRAGDVILLDGDLGAGKTTFARAVIRAGAGDPMLEVPSPTFALVQNYDLPRYQLGHFDLYRLSDAAEAWEIGLEPSLIDAATMIEWPDRLGSEIPAEALRIRFAQGRSPETRDLILAASPAWRQRLRRLQAMIAFVDRAGWGDAVPAFLQGDASRRAYARLHRQAMPEVGVLMDSPVQPDGPVIRDGRSYSGIARLAEDVRPFVAVANALAGAGVSVPAIYAEDLDHGFLLIEDFGDRVFGAEIARGTPIIELYAPAVDVLADLRQHSVPSAMTLGDGSQHLVPDMDRGVLNIEIELLIDWLWPAIRGAGATIAAAKPAGLPTPAEREAFLACWAAGFEWLTTQPAGWVIRDYHSPNLILLPERSGGGCSGSECSGSECYGGDRIGSARIGVIDFQDALHGHPAYDLVSLLQDARLDIPAEIEQQLFERYCSRVQAADASFDRAAFTRAYALLGAQRNTKILGIFARLALRDGKRGYLTHIPRIWDYLERNLKHPDLVDLATWYGLAFPAKDRHIPTTI